MLKPSLYITILLACTLSGYAFSESSISQHPISSGNLKNHVFELADDKYQGRGAGYPGELAAAIYIAEQFSDSGLVAFDKNLSGPQGYLQSFDLHALEAAEPWQILQSQNVIGILPGNELAEQVIVIGAHYDGQGRDGQARLGRDEPQSIEPADLIWNSAVDNAVSIAAIIDIARSLKQANISLKRTVVFVAFGAEESALDGSSYYAANPYGSPDATQAMINLEKIVGDADAPFLYVSYATAPVFPVVTETVTASTNISLDPFYPGVIANSDHYAFILSHIPAITIGTGSVENVHLPTDHAQGLDYALLKKRTGFILEYLVELANSDGDFTFTGNISGKLGASGGSATAAEITTRNHTGKHAFKVASVIKASIADKAGLLPGDLIVAVNGSPIQQQNYYQGLSDLIGEDAVCENVLLSIIRVSGLANVVLENACSGEGDATIK